MLLLKGDSNLSITTLLLSRKTIVVFQETVRKQVKGLVRASAEKVVEAQV